MNNTGKLMKRLGLAVVAAAIASAMVVSVAGAQSPPTPPSRFVGTVAVDGVPAAAGTTVEARIGGTTCGVSTVFLANGQSRYALDSPALDPAGSPGCGVEGSVVVFFVAGRQANETGSWANFQLNTVNLTVAAAVPTTPVPATPTPRVPDAGTGSIEGGSGANLPLMEALLVSAAIGLAGVGLAARARKS